MPAGDYEVRLVLDLSPLFGRLEASAGVELVLPPPDALDRRIEQLASEDPAVRREAVTDLPFFNFDPRRVSWALAACLTDSDGVVRRLALASLQAHRDRAAEYADTVLHILEDGTGRIRGERTNAALLVSRTTPPSNRALAALEKALAEGGEAEKRIFRSALEAYRLRCGEEPGD